MAAGAARAYIGAGTFGIMRQPLAPRGVLFADGVSNNTIWRFVSSTNAATISRMSASSSSVLRAIDPGRQ
jgi:hypothetical protein